MTTTTVNVNENCQSITPGNFNVRAFYNETDAGHLFGVFSSRESAEKCLLILAARSDVIRATIENA